MTRYKIFVEYEGTPFVGWQFQANGISVQGVLEEAILKFSMERSAGAYRIIEFYGGVGTFPSCVY